MKIISLCLAGLLGLSAATGLPGPHQRAQKFARKAAQPQPVPYDALTAGKNKSSSYLTPKTRKFVVNGKNIPEVNFDIGESYAGILPISDNASDPNQLYFWFFPSENVKAKDEIVIWLNGGPGCSSLNGLFQENGPFLWQSGTYLPQPNPFSWTNLTNIVYVDQPIGTGFSPAAPGAPAQIMDEKTVATQFMAFWKNFMKTFDLQGRKVYITGESYAGQYIPYIAYYMLQTNNTQYYNVKGIELIDPYINEQSVTVEAPSVPALNKYADIFGLNATFMAAINKQADVCGWTAWLNNALTFPPKGPQPTPPDETVPGCDVWTDIIMAAIYVNPCFNVYHLTDYCPFLWDVMGFPSLAPPSGDGSNYFNRTDVQKAINAPPTDYAVCDDITLFPNGDLSPVSGTYAGPLASVIERTNNVLIAHGLLDFLLFANGSLATIQNLTWHGKQGFQQPPTDDFFVPYNAQLATVLDETFAQAVSPAPVGLVSGGGIMGTTHTERGLTFVTVNNAGHEVPQYNAAAAYRQLEFLLGRIKSLTQMGDFTTQTGNFTGTTPLVRRRW